MDSPIHPHHRPTPAALPFATRRDNNLIHGHGIELAPAPFQEHVANPAPEVIEPFSQAPEVIPHSTLEVAKQLPPPPQPYPNLLPVHPDIKAWGSKPNSIYADTDRSYSVAPTTAPVSAVTSQRYSETDFSSPFDRRPLVPPPGDGGRKVERDRICGVRRQFFWAGLAVGVFLVVVAIAVGVGVGVGTSGKGAR
jgi:hypothetical protein